MKKLNISEASTIVGGTCKTCSVEYVNLTPTTCNAVTTCVDKDGKVVSVDSKPVALSSCPAQP
ncbi:DUF4762 family protein [Serratia fonticola]|uniref:DUF4762 family protein n=1 Tax=Serratia fonticola TaxID=47917 RepID=A0AAW3WQ50_SERFO|nr:DUF4762 family protein [Serratia fonticola]MBC3212333.1 DUF4762 family protein [Serratia fonticola]NYA12870.1 DUF4762 family protein [Serratia fonticola]NYA32449.1 DUF4762 family protein [Serratia fonticola]